MPATVFEAHQAPDVFATVCAMKLEGLVAKRRGSVYRCGVRSKDWVKVRCPGAEQGFSRRPAEPL
jgi:ATP-dependent DNA ligase